MTSGTAPNTSMILTQEELDFINEHFGGSKSAAIHAGLRKLMESKMINISDRYGDAVAVELEDYQELNPDGEFQEYDETIREYVDGEWEVVAVSETEYERSN